MLKRAIILLAMLTVSILAYADTIIVPDDYPTIQQAIDASVNGDTVLVKPGTYVENIDFIGKAITVQSEQGVGVTVIDGNQAGSVVSCKSGEGPDSVLDGFTITNGEGHYAGGGMCNKDSNPTVKNCTFSENYAMDGGGMCNSNSKPTVTNCTFSGNGADNGSYYNGYGGGMCNFVSNPTVTNCTFAGNSASEYGGGMCNTGSHPEVTNCTFSGNFAGAILLGFGGGMYNMSSNPTVTNCTFSGNSVSDFGGGMCNYSSSPEVTNCTFSGNDAGRWGGGICNDNSSPEVTNCIFSGNDAGDFISYIGYGGGMCNTESHPTVTNCTFTGNWAGEYGGGMYNTSSSPTVTNCILWNNIMGEITGNTIVTYSDVKGGWPGIGNIDSDPLFVDAVNVDFHLTYNSPCRGSGENTAVTELYDFEGDPRIYQGTVDIGADEFYTHLYCMGDFTPGGSIEGKFVGLPGTTPVGLFIGSGVLPSPMNTMWGEYWLQAPWVLLGPLGAIPSNGVMVLPTTLPPGMTVPVDIPMQALIGLNADSLTNLCVLEVK